MAQSSKSRGSAGSKKKSGSGVKNTKKSGSAGKRTSPGGRKPTKAELKRRSEIRIEILSLVMVAVTVLLLLSNFGLCGKAGAFLSALMFGLLGLLAYIFPVVLFIVVFATAANLGNKKAVAKVYAGLAFYVLAAVFIYLVTDGGSGYFSAASVYAACAASHSGGGVIGSAVGFGLSFVFGRVGAFIVVIFLMLICLIFVTEKPVLDMLRRRTGNAISAAREDVSYIRSSNEQKRKDKEQREKENAANAERKRRRNRHVRGVDEIDLNASPSGEMHEIKDEPAFDGGAEGMTAAQGEANASSGGSGNGEVIFNGNIFADERVAERAGEASARTNAAQGFSGTNAAQGSSGTSTAASSGTNAKAAASSGTAAAAAAALAASSAKKKKSSRKYVLPKASDFLNGSAATGGSTRAELMSTGERLVDTLAIYGVEVTLKEVSRGPAVTRYELLPAAGTKISRITSLSDEIKLAMAVSDIRIEAPIPGKSAVGIEIPNSGKEMVGLRDLIEASELKRHSSKLAFSPGKDISGSVVVSDIAQMPHMLIAGTTGSGKSVFMNSLIMNILYRATPDEVRMIIIDPKVVEFGVYNGIPHLLIPVVTDVKKATTALSWAVAEMTERYKKFADLNAKDIKSYNRIVETTEPEEGEEKPEKMPQILILIDELADLMMASAKEVESSICRLAQLARAAGIHLVIATQRPSVDVVTGLIKANIPSRVALLVSSGTDSRTIIGCNGAEKLLGNGDMLFYPSGYLKPLRVQGAFVSDSEISKTVEFWKKQAKDGGYDKAVEQKISAPGAGGPSAGSLRDEYFADAGRYIIEQNKASTSLMQRVFRIGFNRAARLMDQLVEAGVVSSEDGARPRKVLMSAEEFEEYLERTENED